MNLPNDLLNFICQIGVNQSHVLLEAVAQKQFGTTSSIISEMHNLDSLKKDENPVQGGTDSGTKKPQTKPKLAHFRDGPSALKCPIPGCMFNFVPINNYGKYLWFPYEEMPLQIVR